MNETPHPYIGAPETNEHKINLQKRRRLKKKLAMFRLSTFFCLILAAALAIGLGISVMTTHSKVSHLSEQVEQMQKTMEEKDKLLQDAKTQNEALAQEKAAAEAAKQEAENALKEANEIIEGYQSAGKPYKGPKIAYLTFDDGVSSHTEEILEILARYDVKATFFPIWREGKEDVYKKIVDQGHALGNHTATHDWKSIYGSLDGFINEVETLNDKIEAATGKRPNLFRFPGGSNNTIHKNYNSNIIQPAIDWLNEKGITYVDWNADSMDASSTKPLPPSKLTANAIATGGVRQAVILMHDTDAKPTTVEALPAIIEGLKEKGYKFAALTPDVKVQFIKS